MQRLRLRDLEASLWYLPALYAQRDLESFKRYILTTLRSIVPSESVIYVDPSVSVMVDNPAGASVWESEPAFSSPNLTEIVEIHSSYIDENPLINHYQQTRDGQAVKITDFLTQREFRRLGLYNDLFRRVSIDQWMSIVLPHGPLAATAVSLGRSGKDFSERDRLLLNVLRPHLMQAYDNAAALTQAQQEGSILIEQTMEKLDRAVVVLREKRRLQWCTERARKWLREYFGPAQDADHLPDDLRRWVEYQLSALVDQRDIRLPQHPLVMKRAGKRLLVRFVADHSEDRHLLILEEQYIPLSIESLASLGLTNREAQILLGIAQGKTNKAIGEDLYVSPLTVKTHLQRLYRKLGVASRTEALSSALALLELLS
jgi:DNA-binding CsgD family transcriptional regulator